MFTVTKLLGRTRGRISWAFAFAGALWLLAFSVGFAVLIRYEHEPGNSGHALLQWPSESAILRTPGRFTLVVAAHPRCPCSEATFGELAWIMTRCQGLLDATVLFYSPPDPSPDWSQTRLWKAASEIPGVSVVGDVGATEARRFGAATSGHAFLYDANGRLLFDGGITGSRGHRGDNPGRRAVEQLVISEGSTPTAQTPIFGCSIVEQGCEPIEE